MQLQQRINAFAALGKFFSQFSNSVESQEKIPDLPYNDKFYDRMLQKLEAAKNHNAWFTEDNLRYTCQSLSQAISEENLNQWLSRYSISESTSIDNAKTIAVIMAGNIPLVGFHDFISVLMTGNKVLGKLSSNDKQLLPFLSEYLIAVEPELSDYISFTENKLTDFDAVIATGSNNTARYFDYYFKKYPHIIRKNRNSVAVLTGNESAEEMQALADDIFRYFGLGCRNVSKIYLPEGYDLDAFFNGMFSWKNIINNNKYINNYDYNKAVYLMSNFKLLDNEFLLLKEDAGFSSPISVVFYEFYKDHSHVKRTIETQAEQIQAIVSASGIENEIGFGKAQSPQLWDYADGVDTVEFLLKLV